MMDEVFALPHAPFFCICDDDDPTVVEAPLLPPSNPTPIDIPDHCIREIQNKNAHFATLTSWLSPTSAHSRDLPLSSKIWVLTSSPSSLDLVTAAETPTQLLILLSGTIDLYVQRSLTIFRDAITRLSDDDHPLYPTWVEDYNMALSTQRTRLEEAFALCTSLADSFEHDMTALFDHISSILSQVSPDAFIIPPPTPVLT